MIQIYHNPRCTKSRQGVQLLTEKGLEFEELRYLDTGLDKPELQTILKKLDISALELIRKNEAIWKSNYKGKTLSEDELIAAMIQHPKLMERPIVINGNKAVIGRPTENILTIL